MDEELDLHLFELAAAEREIPGCDFVAKGLALLRDAEGDFDARGVDDVPEIDEDALRGFRAEVDFACVILNGAGVALEHEIELARFGQRPGFLGVRAHGNSNFFLREFSKWTDINFAGGQGLLLFLLKSLLSCSS
jgi:hypothetical protein